MSTVTADCVLDAIRQCSTQTCLVSAVLLPAFLENMFTEAVGGPAGPVGATWGTLGNDVGGGGGAFFCRGRDSSAMPLT